jgi:hypothetical protein
LFKRLGGTSSVKELDAVILAAIQLIRRGGGHEGLRIVAALWLARVAQLNLSICSPHGEPVGEQIR